MYNVIFTAPVLNLNALLTIRAVISVPDTQVSLISQDKEVALPAELRKGIGGFYQVRDALAEDQLYDAATKIQRETGKIDRIFASNEQVQVQVAAVREKLGIAGMSSETMRNFRDKSRMKSVLSSYDIPCAKNKLVTSTAEAWNFLRTVGYPVVVKPPEGAGAEFTYKVDNDQAMQSVLGYHPAGLQKPLMIEEFINGDEFSFDSFTVKGKTQWHSLTRYLPAPLEVKQNAWIQWRVVLPREVDDPQYDDIRTVAYTALEVLGAQSGMSHMEWFRRPDGRVVISEVGMRPPGAQIPTLISRAHEFDCMGAWARLMITGAFTAPGERKYAAGCAYLRGQGSGVVRQITGFEGIRHDLGKMITDYRLPEIGQKPGGSYEGEGFIIIRHPQTKVVEETLLHIVSTIRVVLN
ncbi:MAG TPA: ATP-grasp domain-containing protein [Saprospiraceae bacterium]|nr:ATP-grasp domain-containing protein [Saprospiraceae bacterium]